MITISDLTIKYNDFTAVERISFNVKKGTIFGFIGPNGSGKTTTIKVMAGLIQPAEGCILINGMDSIKDAEKIKSLIGYMPDFFGVYNKITVSEYLCFFAEIHNLSNEIITKKLKEVLERANLTVKADDYTDNLSRGMKQRLYIAKLLMHNPEIFILDEPASGLDPHARIELREILKSLKNEGKTIFISSHILPELADVCDDVAIIERGKLKFAGSVSDAIKFAAGSRQISFSILNDSKKIEAKKIIESFRTASNAEFDGNLLCFKYCGDDNNLFEIIKKLVESDIAFIPAAGKLYDFEQAFKNITTGEVR